MMEKADSATPTSRPRRSQQRNSRFDDFEWEVGKHERKPRITSQNIKPEGVKVNSEGVTVNPEGVKVNPEGVDVNSEEVKVNTEGVKRKRGRPRKSENSSAPNENKPQATRTLTKRGLKNYALTTSKKQYVQKCYPKSTEVNDLLQEQGNFEQLPVKKKRGRPPGKKNAPKIKAERRVLCINKREDTLDESDSDGYYPMIPFWKKKSVTFKRSYHTSGSELDFASSPVKKDGLKKVKLEKFEAGKLKLQRLKALAVQRFGTSKGKAEEVNKKGSDEDTDHTSLSSESDEADSDRSSEQFSDFPGDWGSDSSCVNSDEEDMTREVDEKNSKGKNESEKQAKHFGKHSDSFVDGIQKLYEIKKLAVALYNTPSATEDMSETENPTAIPSTESVDTSMTYQVSTHANNMESKGECQENEDDQISISEDEKMKAGKSLKRRSKAKRLSTGGKESFKESEEYHKGKMKLEKMQQMASRLYGVTAQKQQHSVKRQYSHFTDQASSQTHVSSTEYGEIVSVSDSTNPVTTYKLGDKHAYTVTYSEDNPDVLTFALEPPPPPETLSRNNISASLTQDLLKITKNQQLRAETQQTEGVVTDSGIEFSTLLEGGETAGTISILPSTFSSSSTEMSIHRADLQVASDTSEQAQTIVVTAPGQEHLLTDGDMQNTYRVEIQHPDGTTQEHVSFDNGLTFVVNEMHEGSGTVSQNTLPVSLADLADLATLQIASSDGQITNHSLALPEFSFAQEEFADTDNGSIHTHIDPDTLKSLTDGVPSDQPIVFIVKQEEEGYSPTNSSDFTQWSICGNNAIGHNVTQASASSNILNAAAEFSRITGSRRGNISQEFLDGEVNLERLKQLATTFQDSTGNDI